MGSVALLICCTRALRASGVSVPRIAVAALNPHAGEGGLLGTEEITVIGPAIEKSRAIGAEVKGPFPADTLFIAARRGDFDGVVTMYHDQGQIALKLLGFDRGVTLGGGLPVVITTPAHGTAFDIAGKGIADVGASERSLFSRRPNECTLDSITESDWDEIQSLLRAEVVHLARTECVAVPSCSERVKRV